MCAQKALKSSDLTTMRRLPLTERETEGEEHLEVPPDKDAPYKFNREDRGSSRKTTKHPEHPS